LVDSWRTSTWKKSDDVVDDVDDDLENDVFDDVDDDVEDSRDACRVTCRVAPRAVKPITNDLQDVINSSMIRELTVLFI